jgi:hypothetical protein
LYWFTLRSNGYRQSVIQGALWALLTYDEPRKKEETLQERKPRKKRVVEEVVELFDDDSCEETADTNGVPSSRGEEPPDRPRPKQWTRTRGGWSRRPHPWE